MLRVTDFLFNDHAMESPDQYDSWSPKDPDSFEEWVQVLVGQEDGEGHWFQIHVCSFSTISHISKEYLFPIPYWENVDSLIKKLDKFIENTLPDSLNLNDEYHYGLAMENLAKYWCWEYQGYV